MFFYYQRSILDRWPHWNPNAESTVAPRELYNEILLLSHYHSTGTVLGCRRWEKQHSRLCTRKSVRPCSGSLTRDDDNPTCGAITSVAVSRNYRRLGLAQRLMRQSQRKMIEVYNMKKCQLNVRESNYAAQHLYKNVLGFKWVFSYFFTVRQVDVDVKYYADGENGIRMEQDLVALRSELGLPEFKGEEKKSSEKGSGHASERVSEKETKREQKAPTKGSARKSTNRRR